MEKIKLRPGWKIVLRYAAAHKKTITFLAVLGVISALANGFIPYVVGMFFDAILKTEASLSVAGITAPLWIVLLILWIAAQLIANTVDWISDRRKRRLGTRVHAEYQAQVFSRLLELPVSFHKDQKAGKISYSIGRTAWMLDTLLQGILINITPQLLSICVGLAIAFFIQPMLAGVLILGVLVYVGTLVKIVPPVVEMQKKGQEAWRVAYGDAFAALENVHAVKHATAEQYEKKKIHHQFLQVAAPVWYAMENIWSNINFSQRVTVVATQLTVFLFAVHFIHQGTMSIGELVALNGYALMFFGPFVTIGQNWQTIQNGLTELENTETVVFQTPTEPYHPKNAVKPAIQGAVTFDDVSFTYDGKEEYVLERINFTVHPGEVIALVGRSGVGKSTLIDLISGYYFPVSGNVLIDGNDVTILDLRWLRSRIAVVPQEVVLFNDTIETNIRYGRFDATDEEIKSAAREAQADEFIRSFPEGYNQIVGERGIKLSVGQKQRISIARAILRDPAILILDEPTSALDVETEHHITQALERLMHGRTTFIIAHRLSTVRRADRILVIEGGAITETGTHEELINKEHGTYRHLHDLHIGLR